jgi:acetyl-CoA carboxylase biotin carboxyl carrier protein
VQIEHVQQLSAWLAATDIGLLELRGPAVQLRLRNHAGRVEPESLDAPAIPTRIAVIANSVGVFLRQHPLRNAPLAEPGDAVRAGQVLGLLQIGALLLPVVAPHDGIVTATPIEDGVIVGYGTALFELQPRS